MDNNWEMCLREGETHILSSLSFPCIASAGRLGTAFPVTQGTLNASTLILESLRLHYKSTIPSFPKKDSLSQEPRAVPRFVNSDLDPVLAASITQCDPDYCKPHSASGVPQWAMWVPGCYTASVPHWTNPLTPLLSQLWSVLAREPRGITLTPQEISIVWWNR